ncbi:calcium-binding protein [Ensifer aridi]|uniref:calcium-binding protein n=1 Tax=Ensifer aridi TaxID=1708715 RepID=UPI00358F9E4B
MAKITVASNYSFNQTNIDFNAIYDGASYARSGSLFRVTYSNGIVEEFRGSGFSYNAYGEPVSGTVTSYAAFYGGQRLFQVEGSVAATAIVAAAQTYSLDDDYALMTQILSGNDSLTGGNLADVLFGFGGNDWINGKSGNDNLWGYDGNDTIIGGAGQDEINGGNGSDTASYATASGWVRASLAASSSNIGDAYGDTYSSVENLTGSRFGDILTGNGWANSLSGSDGNDTLIGGAGGDKLYGGNGIDTASYANATAAVVASLNNPAGNTGEATGDFYSSIENLTGSKYADRLYGNSGANILSGGAGNDTLFGGAGADKLDGGAGTDTVSYAYARAGVYAGLGFTSWNTGEAKGDTYFSIENLIGSRYADTLFGSAGNDGIQGGAGDDSINAGWGNDFIYGGVGRDRLIGGTDADRFIFKAAAESAGTAFDTIYDFVTSEQDRIDLSAIDASSQAIGDQAFSFVGTAAFKGVAGELRFDILASDTYIYADVNGDKVADLKIHLDDAVALTKGYFIL